MGEGLGRKKQREKMKINTFICLPFSLINCRATSFWNISKLSVSSFMWKSIRKGSPSSVNSCVEKYLMRIIRPLHLQLFSKQEQFRTQPNMQQLQHPRKKIRPKGVNKHQPSWRSPKTFPIPEVPRHSEDSPTHPARLQELTCLKVTTGLGCQLELGEAMAFDK